MDFVAMTVYQWDLFEFHPANVTFLEEKIEINRSGLRFSLKNEFSYFLVTIRILTNIPFSFGSVFTAKTWIQGKKANTSKWFTVSSVLSDANRLQDSLMLSLPVHFSASLNYSAVLVFHWISVCWQLHRPWRSIFVWYLGCMHGLYVHAAHNSRLLWLCCSVDNWFERDFFDGLTANADFYILFHRSYTKMNLRRVNAFAEYDISIYLTTKSICNTPHI